MKEYIALFEYEENAPGFGVVFPDLPGLISAGDDYEEAFRMAHEALSLYADGEMSMPEPRSLEKIKSEWDEWSEWETSNLFYIGRVALYPLKAKSKKFNISMDEGLVERIDRVTQNRSAFIVAAVEKFLSSGA